MIQYSRKVWILERCGKQMYITSEHGQTLKSINFAFDDEQIHDGQAITLQKCNSCCFNIYRTDVIKESNILSSHTPLNNNGVAYDDEHIDEAFDVYPENSLLDVFINIITNDGDCDCQDEKLYYFDDLCSDDVYAIEATNFYSVNDENVTLNTNILYELWFNNTRHICTYVESADDPTIVMLSRKIARNDIPIEKYDCGGSFVFKKCDSDTPEYYLFVDGIEVSELQQDSYYLVRDSEGFDNCYKYIGRNSNVDAEQIIHIVSGSYKDCSCKKGNLLFQTCDGEYTIECDSWLESATYTINEYYSVSTGAFQPVLIFDGYKYKNCLKFIGYTDDNPEIEPTYTGLMINKSSSCEHDDCSIYFETTLSSCLGDYETTVYVSGELLNYMRENDYNSFVWNGKNCLTLPYGIRYVDTRSDDIPTIEKDDVDTFYKDCDECMSTLDISCYVIHPCDGSRDIYIEKAGQGAMCEPVDLSIYENRYISFNYFGKVMCGYVEQHCKELTESDRRISSNNIIECYYSCAECIDNEEEKQKEVQETKQKVGREIEPNYTAHGEYCNKNHKHCCCDDD